MPMAEGLQNMNRPVDRQEKHILALSKMDLIWRTLEALEGLANRIEPQPSEPATAQPPIPQPTLSRFLDNLPADMMLIAERIEKATKRIQTAVL